MSDGVAISILVAPRSSKNEIAGIHGDLLKVKIMSPPVDGEANEACIKFFSKLIGTPKSDVLIVKGDKSKRKKIKLVGISLDKATGIIKNCIKDAK